MQARLAGGLAKSGQNPIGITCSFFQLLLGEDGPREKVLIDTHLLCS
jgi:hypothetical protein